MFWCGRDMLLDVSCHGNTVLTCISVSFVSTGKRQITGAALFFFHEFCSTKCMKCDILTMERAHLRSAARFHGEKYILDFPGVL